MRLERHDGLCELLGTHDHFCPPTEPALEIVKHEPGSGKWMKGTSGNVYGPRRIRAARALISEMSDGGRTIIERLFALAGLGEAQGIAPTGAVQVRAAIRLSEILWGKQIKVSGKVEHQGKVEHEHVAVTEQEKARRLLVSKLTDEQLRVLEEVHRTRAEIVDAEFTEVPKDVTPGDDT